MPTDAVDEPQPEVEELDEILQPEQILAHKERKARGKVSRRYLVKFKNYSHMDAKWMEEGDLADSPQVLDLYLEAFWLEPTINRAFSGSAVRSGVLPDAQEGSSSAPLSQTRST